MYLCLMLPFPPSANNLFAGKSRRYVSRAYREWRTEAGWALKRQKIARFPGPVSVAYTFGRPDKRRRDLGNLEKAVSDLLVDHAIIADDSMIERLVLAWDGEVVGCRVELEGPS